MRNCKTMSRILLSLCACSFAMSIFAAPPAATVEARLDVMAKKLDEQNAKIDMLSQQILKLQQQLGGSNAQASVTSPSPNNSRPGVMIGEGTSSSAATSTTSTSPTPPLNGTSHIVARGETLTSIAKSYNVSITDLQKYNHIENPLKLQAGQTLMIPPSSSPAPSSSGE